MRPLQMIAFLSIDSPSLILFFLLLILFSPRYLHSNTLQLQVDYYPFLLSAHIMKWAIKIPLEIFGTVESVIPLECLEVTIPLSQTSQSCLGTQSAR